MVSTEEEVRKLRPSDVIVDCKTCGDPLRVDGRTFDLAHEVSDGRFNCDGCSEVA